MDEFVYAALAVLIVTVVVIAVVLLGVMRQLGTLLLELRPGQPQPAGGGPDPHARVDLAELELARSDGGALVVFISPNCQLCDAIRPALSRLPRDYRDLAIAAVIPYGSDSERDVIGRELGGLVRPDLLALHDAWQIPGTPYVVSIDRSGRVRGKGVVTTGEGLALMADAAQLDPEEWEEDSQTVPLAMNGASAEVQPEEVRA